jgi:hypothetical protein
MTTGSNVVDIEKTNRIPLLERTQKAVELDEMILDDLVAKYNVAAEDERSFRLGHRAQWRAIAALDADDAGSVAEYVEVLRDSTIHPQNTHDAELAAKFAELMQKIAA